MFLWRPIARGLCTLAEAKSILTIDDFADLNELADLQDAIEAAARPAKGTGR